MKQILIEKYIEPSKVEAGSDGAFIKYWFDKYDDLHSFMNHPACVVCANGQIIN
jgi:hypothetical protein